MFFFLIQRKIFLLGINNASYSAYQFMADVSKPFIIRKKFQKKVPNLGYDRITQFFLINT